MLLVAARARSNAAHEEAGNSKHRAGAGYERQPPSGRDGEVDRERRERDRAAHNNKGR